MTSVKLRPTYIAGKTYPVWKFNKCIEVDGAILNSAVRIGIEEDMQAAQYYQKTETRIARIEASLQKAGLLLTWAQFDNL